MRLFALDGTFLRRRGAFWTSANVPKPPTSMLMLPHQDILTEMSDSVSFHRDRG
jgi:hypothetical protein